MRKVLIKILTFYKKIITPILVINFGHACRFTPTCSEYAKEAIAHFGIVKGLILSLKRVSRCHPFGGYGYDPVTDKI